MMAPNDFNMQLLPQFGTKKAAAVAATTLDGYTLPETDEWRVTLGDGAHICLVPASLDWDGIHEAKVVPGTVKVVSGSELPRSGSRRSRKRNQPLTCAGVSGTIVLVSGTEELLNEAILALSNGDAAAIILCGTTSVESVAQPNAAVTAPVFATTATLAGMTAALASAGTTAGTIARVTLEAHLSRLLRVAATNAEKLMGDGFESKVRQCLAQAYADVNLPEAFPPAEHSAVLCAFELSLLMFHSSAVYSDRDHAIVNALPVSSLELATISAGNANELTGVTAFADLDSDQLRRYAHCELDPRTLKPWEDPSSPFVLAKLAGAVPVSVAQVRAPAAVATQDDDTVPADLDRWSIKKCKSWLDQRIRNGTLPKYVKHLRELIRQYYENGLQNHFAADIEAVAKERYTANVEAWKRVDEARVHGVPIAPGDVKLDAPTLPEDWMRWAFDAKAADSARNVEKGMTRYWDDGHLFIGKEERSLELKFSFRRVIWTCTVGRSFPGTRSNSMEKQAALDAAGHAGRVTMLTGLVVGRSKGAPGRFLGPPEYVCLIPKKFLDHSKQTIMSGKGDSYRPCRDALTCVHLATCGAAYMALQPQGVDGPNQWQKQRATNHRLDRDSFADTVPVQGHPAYQRGKCDAFAEKGMTDADVVAATRSSRSTFCPIATAKLNEIDKGPKSTVYRGPFDTYVAAKKEALKRKHGPDSTLTKRPLKVQVIMQEVTDCTCAWSPSTQTWISDCNVCGPGKTYTAAYVYDRGLTQTAEMIRSGLTVMIPSRKGSGQIAFSALTNTSDRYIARERITIERGNLELRYYDGFDCQIPPSMVDLAGREGSCARGLCNLRIELTDWTQRSYKGETVDLTK
jgi:hypothetical protein